MLSSLCRYAVAAMLPTTAPGHARRNTGMRNQGTRSTVARVVVQARELARRLDQVKKPVSSAAAICSVIVRQKG